jgi:hypothetical protein
MPFIISFYIKFTTSPCVLLLLFIFNYIYFIAPDELLLNTFKGLKVTQAALKAVTFYLGGLSLPYLFQYINRKARASHIATLIWERI